MSVEELNLIDEASLKEGLFKCCGSSNWVEKMLRQKPFTNAQDLEEKAKICWKQCSEADFLEAFTHHPKIGDLKSLESKFNSTKNWAEKEQQSVKNTPLEVLEALRDLNEAYFEKFGFIFIIYASDKSASQMLDALKERIKNTRQQEINNSAIEQEKITILRLQKLLQ